MRIKILFTGFLFQNLTLRNKLLPTARKLGAYSLSWDTHSQDFQSIERKPPYWRLRPCPNHKS